jgi:hypothetical protein
MKVIVLVAMLALAGCGDSPIQHTVNDTSAAKNVGPFSVERVTSGIHFKKGMDQKISIYGINVYKHKDAASWAFSYGATVLADYLDSDEDGQPDDPAVIAALTSVERKEGVAILNQRGDIGSGHYKDSFWGISRVGGQTSLDSEGHFKRQTIEEFHHAFYHGLEIAYPSVFGTEPGTELMVAVEQAYGDCEFCSDCAPDCEHYDCEGPGDCTFVAGSCGGASHYAEPGCGPGGCLAAENFYLAWTSLYGLQIDYCASLASEWEPCSPEAMMTDPRVEMLYLLVSGQSDSAVEFGYVLPSAAPDGHYEISAP